MKHRLSSAALAIFMFMTFGCAATVPVHHVNPTPQAAVAIDRWADNYPGAANDLGNWVKKHPQAARKFFEWDGTHHDRSKLFVTWAITHSRENIDTFVLQHLDWSYFGELMEHHRPAAQEFINWCRRHPRAAEALMNHPSGLQWAGNHLYKAYWEMKNM